MTLSKSGCASKLRQPAFVTLHEAVVDIWDACHV